MKTQHGFTLIELMIVVAIIAILAAIAISQYQDYVAKAQFSEAPSIVDGLKTKIVENFSQTATCPSNLTTPGFPAPASYAGKYVKQLDLGTAGGACTITATFKPSGSAAKGIFDQTVVFTGTDVGGTFAWTCSSTIDNKYKPKACQ
jgi:type IV pilus assembly protein PilA